jgi:hypothetical protein
MKLTQANGGQRRGQETDATAFMRVRHFRLMCFVTCTQQRGGKGDSDKILSLIVVFLSPRIQKDLCTY